MRVKMNIYVCILYIHRRKRIVVCALLSAKTLQPSWHTTADAADLFFSSSFLPIHSYSDGNLHNNGIRVWGEGGNKDLSSLSDVLSQLNPVALAHCILYIIHNNIVYTVFGPNLFLPIYFNSVVQSRRVFIYFFLQTERIF